MLRLSHFIDQLNSKIGKLSGWLILAMAILTFIIVILRYFFNLGWIWLQDLVSYLHGISFMLVAAYGLLKNEHVRVDIFYQSASPQKQAKVNILGTIFLLFPLCLMLWFFGFEYVFDSWHVLEGSKESGGLGGVYLVKSLVILFPSLLFLQGLSEVIKSVDSLKAEGKNV